MYKRKLNNEFIFKWVRQSRVGQVNICQEVIINAVEENEIGEGVENVRKEYIFVFAVLYSGVRESIGDS